MKDKKDEKLNNLFSDYVQEEQLPPESVTANAAEFMRTNAQKQKSAVAVPIAETAEGSERGGNAERKKYIIAIAAAFVVLVLCAVLICYAIANPKLDSEPFDLATSVEREQISEEQLQETSDEGTATSDERRIPAFVEQNSITEYKEYALTEAVGDYSTGEIVLRYLEFSVAEKQAKLYVESENIYFDELAFYKGYEADLTYSGINFLYGIDKEQAAAYVYFQVDSYGYNLELNTSDSDVLQSILADIAEKL